MTIQQYRPKKRTSQFLVLPSTHLILSVRTEVWELDGPWVLIENLQLTESWENWPSLAALCTSRHLNTHHCKWFTGSQSWITHTRTCTRTRTRTRTRTSLLCNLRRSVYGKMEGDTSWHRPHPLTNLYPLFTKELDNEEEDEVHVDAHPTHESQSSAVLLPNVLSRLRLM